MIDLGLNVCYTEGVQTFGFTGRFAFLNAVNQAQYFIVGKAPRISGLTSRRTSEQLTAANAGRFVMSKEMYGLTYEQLYKDYVTDNLRQEDIAQKYSLGQWKIHNAIKVMGIPSRRSGTRAIPLETLVKCTHCGETYPWSPDYFMPGKTKESGCKQPCKKCNVDRVGKWQKENRGRVNANQRAKYDPQKNYLKNQAWEKANPEKVREKTKRRRAVKKSAFSDLTINDWQLCLGYWENKCAYCGSLPDGSSASELTQDHIIPLTHPDSPGHTLSNIIPACRSCNSSKYNRHMRDWLTFKFGQPLANKIEQKITAYTRWIGERLLETMGHKLAA